jgi:hypothetical protein
MILPKTRDAILLECPMLEMLSLRRASRDGLLVVVVEPINKGTEMHPLVCLNVRSSVKNSRQMRAALLLHPRSFEGSV